MAFGSNYGFYCCTFPVSHVCTGILFTRHAYALEHAARAPDSHFSVARPPRFVPASPAPHLSPSVHLLLPSVGAGDGGSHGSHSPKRQDVVSEESIPTPDSLGLGEERSLLPFSSLFAHIEKSVSPSLPLLVSAFHFVSHSHALPVPCLACCQSRGSPCVKGDFVCRGISSAS